MISPLPYSVSNPSLYKPGARGDFFFYDRDSQSRSWTTECREVVECFVSDYGANLKHMGFRCANLDINRLNQFFDLFAPHTKGIAIHPTNWADCVIIDVPLFWRKNATRRGFFTLLLRCGAMYYRGNLNAALKKYPLTRKILPAVNRFLSGHTALAAKSLNGGGIVDHFAGRDEEDVQTMLMKP